jgi:hypothetical protein
MPNSDSIPYPVLYEWAPEKPPGDGDRHAPTRYQVVSCPDTEDGILVLAEYDSSWYPNPWNTRPLIKHLMEMAIAIKTEEMPPTCPNCGNEFFCEIETY